MLKKISLFSIIYFFLAGCSFANDVAINGGESVLSPVTQKDLTPVESAATEKTTEPVQSTPTTPDAQAQTTAPTTPKAPKAPQNPNDKKSAQTEGVRAGDIYVSCKDYFENKFNTKENISKRATCNGYFFGIGSTLLTLNSYGIATNVCLPKDITTHQVIQAFIDWGKANTDNLSIQATEATLKALGARFPCQ